MERPRKAPAVEKNINQITEDDIRVRVFGQIAEKGQNWIILEDAGSKIKVETGETLEVGKTIRVFGRPIKTEQGIEISSELIQDMSALNGNLYKKIQALNNK